jgi:leucyl aminopeptidase
VKFSTKTGKLDALQTGCLILGMFESGTQPEETSYIDQASGGFLSKLSRQGDLSGKSGSVAVLHQLAGVIAQRIVVVGLGKSDEITDSGFCTAVVNALRKAKDTGSTNVVIAVDGVQIDQRDGQWKARQYAIATHDALYGFDNFKTTKNTPVTLKEVSVFTADKAAATRAEAGLKIGDAVGQGVSLTRDLGNLPGNVCTPTYLAVTAKKIASEHKLKVEILERKEMAALGMNTLLSVSAGSHQPPKFIVLKHLKGAAKAKPVVLVGKGVTFDSGGISLKPGAEMDEMKYDMCGAASVLGTMKTAALLNLPVNLIALIPATENMPGGNATRPGDIIKSMSGLTVEILNTDAEGRLILCDALTYAERFDPAAVIDVATLTGACVIALGHVTSGLLSNNDALAAELLSAAKNSGDRTWQMPLWEEYQEQLKSNFADMANIGGRAGGTITAAAFLSRFAKKYPWAHLDIAGTAWKSGKDKGATGRPVPLLVDFVITRAGTATPKAAAHKKTNK